MPITHVTIGPLYLAYFEYYIFAKNVRHTYLWRPSFESMIMRSWALLELSINLVSHFFASRSLWSPSGLLFQLLFCVLNQQYNLRFICKLIESDHSNCLKIRQLGDVSTNAIWHTVAGVGYPTFHIMEFT